jgi:hypothetical protein
MDRGQTLRDLIVEHGLLKAEQIEEIQRRADRAGKKFEDIIREEKLIYPEPLAQLKATSLGVPYLDLGAAKIDAAAMEGISAKAADTYQFVAFGIQRGRLQVAMAAPEDFQAQEAVRFIASQRGLKPDIYCASPDAIKRAIAGDAGDARQALKDFGQEFKRAGDLPRESDKLRSALAKAPITKIVAVIIPPTCSRPLWPGSKFWPACRLSRPRCRKRDGSPSPMKKRPIGCVSRLCPR